MARAARDRGVDAAQTSTAAAIASAAPASSQPNRRAAAPRPSRAPPPRARSRPRTASGTFPGVPGNRGPRSPAPCRRDPGHTPPSRPPKRGQGPLGPSFWRDPSSPYHTLPGTPATHDLRTCPFILNSGLLDCTPFTF